MYRDAAEEGRPLMISYSDANEHVLVVMDGTYSEVKFVDFSIIFFSVNRSSFISPLQQMHN